MKHIFLFCTIFFSVFGSKAQHKVSYTLVLDEAQKQVEVKMTIPPILASKARLVIPQSAPGTYEITPYINFVNDVTAFTKDQKLEGKKGLGSYFVFEGNEIVQQLSYTVDIGQMEKQLLGAFASCKFRSHYLGILGYAVFGFIEGQEVLPINLTINSTKEWPFFTTLQPSIQKKYGHLTFEVEHFGILADAQYLWGTAVKLYQVPNSPVPLYVAAYSETAISIKEIGSRALRSLNGLKDYFGHIPMPYYTLCYEFLNPISPKHDYGFSMEHLNSMTASMPIQKAITAPDPKASIGSTVHHMAHSWIPLRSYGTGYRPFNWQVAPLIETIWLNEGFVWYVTYVKVLQQAAILKRFRKIVNTAPDFIKNKPLKELSLLGSTQYSNDFRIGRNLFARGGLLAADLDDLIQKQTQGKKSLKDALNGLLHWTEKHNRAFTYEEIPEIIKTATSVDISEVWKAHQ